MSFILDALKKSENDRQRQSAPALFEVKVAAPRRRFPLWAVALAVLLGVNVLVLLWFLLREPAGATPPRRRPPLPAPAAATAPARRATRHGHGARHVTYIPANAPPAVTERCAYARTDAGVVAPSTAPPLAEEPVLSGQEPSVPPDYDARDYRPAITPEQANAIAAARRAGIAAIARRGAGAGRAASGPAARPARV